MKHERLERLLQGAGAPDELGAERRAWAVVRAAYAEAEPRAARRLPVRTLVALAAVLAVVAAAASPPGRALGGWVREAIAVEPVPGVEDAAPALTELPSPGRLLVLSERGAWVVRQDGSKRLLGAASAATWSPQGLHVALARGPRLAAVTPDGDVRWTVTRMPRIVAPAWSPSGFRVAYGAGRTLRVVHGDGARDRLVARGVVPGSWAWWPDEERNLIAFVTRRRTVRIVNVDTERVLSEWAPRGSPPLERVVWSADGRRYAALARGRVWLLAANGRVLASPRLPGRVGDAAFAPNARRLAVVTRQGEESRVVVLRARPDTSTQVLFTGAGRLGRLAWAPDGRWLLVAWPSAEQWLFLRAPRVGRVLAVSDVRREFDPAGPGDGRFPQPAGWCC